MSGDQTTARAALDARCEDLCEDVQRHLADVSVLMREDGFRHGAQFDECTCVCLRAALSAQAAETRAECIFAIERKVGLAVMIHANGKTYRDGINAGLANAADTIRALAPAAPEAGKPEREE